MSKRSESPIDVELLQAIQNAERQSAEAKLREAANKRKSPPRKRGRLPKALPKRKKKKKKTKKKSKSRSKSKSPSKTNSAAKRRTRRKRR